jgi:hypothetical protein
LNRITPPGLRIVVATVTGWMPVSEHVGLMLKASTPPENEIGSWPSKSCESFWATWSESGSSERPDMYISSAGSSARCT